MPMTPLTSEREKKHNDSDQYFICQKKFNNNPASKYYKHF